MIVAPMFEGDDMALAMLQHDHYGNALAVIVQSLASQFRDACLIAGQSLPESEWPIRPEVDHRTIQQLHDRFAAAWRHSVNAPQGLLCFDGNLSTDEPTMEAWEIWLRREIGGWWQSRPSFSALAITALRYQNSQVGMDAEEELDRKLVERFSDVPWSDNAASENHSDFSEPEDYLYHLADTLCLALAECTEEERADWLGVFRKFADHMGLHWIVEKGGTIESEIRAAMAPGNELARHWARTCIEKGLARRADPHDPDSVIGRMWWPS